MVNASVEPAKEKRFLLMQIGLSVLVGGLALPLVLTASERDLWWWITLGIVLVSVGEIVWSLFKLSTLGRSQQRLS